MYADVTFQFQDEEDDSFYISSYFVFQSFGSDELVSLLKNKFTNQTKNLIKFLNNRKQFIDYAKELKSLDMNLPSVVPIELICDCTIHLSVFEIFTDNQGSLEELLTLVPCEIFEITDRKILIEALKYRGILQMGSEELKSDPELVLKAIEVDGSYKKGSFKYASKSLRKDPSFFLDAIEIDPDILKYADSSLINDPEFIRKVTRKHLYCLRFIGEELASDEDFLTSIIIENSLAIACLGELAYSLFTDLSSAGEEIVQLFETFADMSRSDLIEHVKGISHDKEQMKQLLRFDGLLLEYCTEELKNDRSVVTIAIKNNGSSLQFAAPQFKMDLEIVGFACKDSEENFLYASDSVRSNFDFIIDNLKNGIDLLPYHTAEIDEMLKLIGYYCFDDFIQFTCDYLPNLGSDLDLIVLIVERCWAVRSLHSEWPILQYVSPNIIPVLGREILLKIIKLDAENYELLPTEIQEDMEIRAIYISNNLHEFTTLPQYLTLEYAFIKLLIENNTHYSIIDYLPEMRKTKDVARGFVKNYACAIKYFPSYLDDVDFIRETNLMAIEFAHEFTQIENLNLIVQAMEKDSTIISSLSESIQIELLKQYKPDLMRVLSKNCELYLGLCNELQIERDIIMTCVGSPFGGHLLSFIPETFLPDRDFILSLVRKNGFAYQSIREEGEDDDEFELEALKSSGWFDSSLLYHNDDAKTIYTIFKQLLNQRLKFCYSEDFYIPSRYSSLSFRVEE